MIELRIVPSVSTALARFNQCRRSRRSRSTNTARWTIKSQGRNKPHNDRWPSHNPAMAPPTPVVHSPLYTLILADITVQHIQRASALLMTVDRIHVRQPESVIERERDTPSLTKITIIVITVTCKAPALPINSSLCEVNSAFCPQKHSTGSSAIADTARYVFILEMFACILYRPN